MESTIKDPLSQSTFDEWITESVLPSTNAALLCDCDTLTAQSKLQVKLSRCAAQPCKHAWFCCPQASFAHGYRQYRDILQCHPVSPKNLYAEHALSRYALKHEPARLQHCLPTRRSKPCCRRRKCSRHLARILVRAVLPVPSSGRASSHLKLCKAETGHF